MQKLEKKKTNVPAIWQYLKQFATPYRVCLLSLTHVLYADSILQKQSRGNKL